MKILKTAAALLATAVLATTFGCASTRTHEGTGQYVDDSVITAKVKSAILGEPGLKVSEINVETFKGAVQLSGFVDSSAQKSRAGRLAAEVTGVRDVKNHITVK